jgi:hypothetical protein
VERASRSLSRLSLDNSYQPIVWGERSLVTVFFLQVVQKGENGTLAALTAKGLGEHGWQEPRLVLTHGASMELV